MPLKDELCFVQFMHPGNEHRPDRDGFKDWNPRKRKHKRKFLESPGRCFRNGEPSDGPLHFWGEWEAQSFVTDIADPVPYGPEFVNKPFYVVPASYDGLQNTDPFVFGGFFYTGCQQTTKRGPTQLRYLERGSVILFGSRVGKQFAVDTVFVVDHWVEHSAANLRQRIGPAVPAGYWDVTLSAWYQKKRSGSDCATRAPLDSFRLYWGATFENPVYYMFSFFPCQPAKMNPRGFARPVISIPGIVNPVLTQGKRLNRRLALSKVQEHWNDVRQQIEAANLWLGVSADMPECRESVPDFIAVTS